VIRRAALRARPLGSALALLAVLAATGAPGRVGGTPAAQAASAAEPYFDIGLAVDLDSLTIEPVGGATLSWRAPDGADRTFELREPLRLRVSGAQVLVEPVGRARAVPLAVLEPSDTLWVGEPALEDGAEPGLRWNGHPWRGRFKAFLSPRRRLTLVTRLSLERYLLGVVPGEIGALRDSLIEAGRAQAIAARSYSLFYRGRRGAEGFDLYASVEDQLYSPVDSERPLATRCVESTRGAVCTAGHEPIRANYCSTCGGISAEAWEAWPTGSYPYLRSVVDRGWGEGDHCALSPQYRWREEWPVAEFAADLVRYGPAQHVTLPPAGLGEVMDVGVLARSRSARVWTLRVTTTTGAIDVPAYGLRQVLRRPGNPKSILRSNLFKIAVRRDATGRAVSVVASGAGSGHGVGLCQTGALAMARAGASADAILEHYYAGTTVEKLW
jgi:stage II sporulation protein D